MRIYVATTWPGLAAARSSGRLAEAGTSAHAVTPGMREWYVTGDDEELEYAAMVDAAQASLRAVADAWKGGPAEGPAESPAEGGVALLPRRVVVAADVAETAAAVRSPGSLADDDRSAVVLRSPVALSDAVSIHVDEAGAEATVRSALSAIDEADAGDDDARFLLDEVEACDLLWFDVTEIDDLLAGPPV